MHLSCGLIGVMWTEHQLGLPPGRRQLPKEEARMDGSRFDALSRALADGAPRRTFLKILLGSVAGLAGGAHEAAAQAQTNPCAPPGQHSSSLQQKHCYDFCSSLY